MGFRVSLVSVEGKPVSLIHEEYGVLPTGETEEFPESPINGAHLPNGSYLLYINDDQVPTDRVLRQLSSGATVYYSDINETCMCSRAACWVNGIEAWSVWHDAQQGLKHLEASGDLPKEFSGIKEIMFARQEEPGNCDFIFDIPVEMIKILGGFHYADFLEGGSDYPYEILKRVKLKRTWWPWK